MDYLNYMFQFSSLAKWNYDSPATLPYNRHCVR